MSVKVYDVTADEFREATQEDIKRLEKAMAAFGVWRAATQALLDVTLEMGQGKRPLCNLARAITEAKPPYSEAAQ